MRARRLDELTAVAARDAGDREPAPGGRWVGRGPAPRGRHGGVIAELIRAGHVDGARAGRGGRDARRRDGGRRRARRRGRLHGGAPFKPSGALHALRGNLAPEGSVVKLAGTERMRQTRPGARVRLRGGVRGGGALGRGARRATCS